MGDASWLLVIGSLRVRLPVSVFDLTLDRSVGEVGRNQRVPYLQIVLDLTLREVHAGEIGCALVAMPYFHLARAAYPGISR